MPRHFIVTADGGSRGNPGAAAYGAVIYENDKVVKEIGAAIGEASNNVAEYSGLIAGLKAANEIDPAATILVKMDSKLVIEQMSGRWKVKHPNMQKLVKRRLPAMTQSLFPINGFRERKTLTLIQFLMMY